MLADLRRGLEKSSRKFYTKSDMVNQQKSIVEKGKSIFYKIKNRLGKKYQPGYFVTIEVNSGKYFVGKNPTEAIKRAKKNFPHKQFFLTQVGRVAGMLK